MDTLYFCIAFAAILLVPGATYAQSCTDDASCQANDPTRPICLTGGMQECVADPCKFETCNGHGTCAVDKTTDLTVAVAICPLCSDGYTGDRCQTAPIPTTKTCRDSDCKNGGVCSFSGIRRCTCPDGFEGDWCETKKAGTTTSVDCMTTGFCKNNGICPTSGTHAYRTPCECPSGYKGDTCETKLANSGNEAFPTTKLLLMTKMFNLTMSFP